MQHFRAPNCALMLMIHAFQERAKQRRCWGATLGVRGHASLPTLHSESRFFFCFFYKPSSLSTVPIETRETDTSTDARGGVVKLSAQASKRRSQSTLVCLVSKSIVYLFLHRFPLIHNTHTRYKMILQISDFPSA